MYIFTYHSRPPISPKITVKQYMMHHIFGGVGEGFRWWHQKKSLGTTALEDQVGAQLYLIRSWLSLFHIILRSANLLTVRIKRMQPESH